MPMEMIAALSAVIAGMLCIVVFFLWRAKAALESRVQADVAARASAEATLAQVQAERDTEAQFLQTQLSETKQKLAAIEQEIRDYTGRIAKSDAEREGLQDKLKLQQENVQQLQTQFQQQFENLANKIFEEKNTQSKKNLDELLAPLKNDLTGFKKHIDEKFGEHGKEQFALRKEIENVVKASSDMRFQTENLSKALKGDVKAQGNWGEVVLERILEAAGLRKGEEYIAQAAGMGLKHPDHGGLQKPDIVIMLPEGKHAIVDSKVSLTHYERFCAEGDDAVKAVHLAQFVQSMRAHVKGLEERRYQDTDGLNTPEYVIMFMPIEGAYSLAMQSDAELHADAWNRKVVITCPSTLFAILKIIASMWKFERQNKNAEEIAKRGGMLYDKVVNFVTELQKVGKGLEIAQGSYDGAMKKLADKGGILVDTEKMKKLGAKASKALPVELVEQDEPLLSIAKGEVA
jgi:DNA recombination protein RmuC